MSLLTGWHMCYNDAYQNYYPSPLPQRADATVASNGMTSLAKSAHLIFSVNSSGIEIDNLAYDYVVAARGYNAQDELALVGLAHYSLWQPPSDAIFQCMLQAIGNGGRVEVLIAGGTEDDEDNEEMNREILVAMADQYGAMLASSLPHHYFKRVIPDQNNPRREAYLGIQRAWINADGSAYLYLEAQESVQTLHFSPAGVL